MKVLVTGGMGFIGFHTVAKLLHSNHEVMILDRQRRADPWQGRVTIVLGDIRNRETVTERVGCKVSAHFDFFRSKPA